MSDTRGQLPPPHPPPPLVPPPLRPPLTKPSLSSSLLFPPLPAPPFQAASGPTICLKHILFKPAVKNSFIKFTFSRTSPEKGNLWWTVSPHRLCTGSIRVLYRMSTQQEVKVFQKKFLQPAFLSRGASNGPLPVAAARSRST